MANIIGNLMGHTLGRSVEELIWSWIRSKLKEMVLDLIENKRESFKFG